MNFKDPEIQKFYDKFEEHDRDSVKFRDQLESLSERVDNQMKTEELRMTSYIEAQERNTKALDKFIGILEKQVKDTSDMVSAWKNVKGSIEVMGVIGRAVTWLLKMSAIVTVATMAVWGWMGGGD